VALAAVIGVAAGLFVPKLLERPSPPTLVGDIVLTPPTTLIDTDTVVDLDGLEAHLLYVGPAHTPGDVVVHLPTEGIVFTGDILFHHCTPIGWEGTFANWIAA